MTAKGGKLFILNQQKVTRKYQASSLFYQGFVQQVLQPRHYSVHPSSLQVFRSLAESLCCSAKLHRKHEQRYLSCYWKMVITYKGNGTLKVVPFKAKR